MSILPLHTPAFDIEATQTRVLNAIATQTPEFPTQRSNHQYAARRCVTVENARTPQDSRDNREGGDRR
jgi:hypothetical protein